MTGGVDGDMLARLGELQAKVSAFGRLAQQLAAALPHDAEGRDASGSVRVVVGRDALPATISVADGWRQRIEPDRLAAAVMDANADAVRRAVNAWSDRLDETRRADADADADAAPPPTGIARDPAGVTEEVLAALRTVQQPVPRPATTDGSNPGRQVSVTLGPAGLLGCTIDARWAAGRDGATVTAALAAAVTAAKAALPGRPAPQPDVDRLLGDALATLQAVTGRRPSVGGVHD